MNCKWECTVQHQMILENRETVDFYGEVGEVQVLQTVRRPREPPGFP